MGWNRHPGEVVVDGAEEVVATSDKDDDFFSSWDKPAIKRPTPPPSRTATPPVIGRTPSPLNSGLSAANGNGIARSKSPLSSTPAATPAASRTTSSAALRNKSTVGGARKGGILGAKKAQKLGAKKVSVVEVDFDEAEKKAKEEADRIARLGYDPEAEEKKEVVGKKAAVAVPASPVTSRHQRNSSDTERLGLQMNRLGFGMVGAAAAPRAF